MTLGEKMPEKAPDRYMLYCDHCGRKVVVVDPKSVGMTEIKVAPTPGGSPYFDIITKKTVIKPSTPRPKMFKCTQCGRGIVLRKNNTPVALPPEKEKNNEEGIPTRRKTGLDGWPVS